MQSLLVLANSQTPAGDSSRERPGVRRTSGAFERSQACEKLQRAGALQNAGARFVSPTIGARVKNSVIHQHWSQLDLT